MSFPRYRGYKDSGVAWLGSIPLHWDIGQSRRLFALRNERANPDDEQLTASQEHGVIPQKLFMEIEGRSVVQVILNTEILKHVEPGDFVISMRSFQGGIEYAAHRGSISSAYVMLIPSPRVHEPFFKFLFKSQVYIQALQSTTNLVRDGQALRYQNFTMVDLPLVPVDEQRAIAFFLENETSKIDALVAEQRRLIELLTEKRQAVISHAVTKGLDPNVKMKPSGIEWLGDVPDHWGTPPVFARYFAVLGKMVDEAKQTGMHPVRYIRNADVNWDTVNTDNLPFIDIKPEELERFTLAVGDLVICEGGAGVGQTAIWDGELVPCAFQKALHRLRPWDPKNENPRFFFYCMRYVVETGIVLAGGTATIPHLTGEQLRKYRFPRPPLVEQDEIVQYLDSQFEVFAELEAEANRAITLLQERRIALISAAVTGKIDVRSFAGKEVA